MLSVDEMELRGLCPGPRWPSRPLLVVPFVVRMTRPPSSSKTFHFLPTVPIILIGALFTLKCPSLINYNKLYGDSINGRTSPNPPT